MGLSRHEKKQAAALVEEAQSALRAAGLDPESLSGSIRSVANVINDQGIAQQLATTEKVVSVGVSALGVVTAGAWGVENLSKKWSQYWPRMTGLADNAKTVRLAVEPALRSILPLLEQVARQSRLIAEFQRGWLEVLPPNLRGIADLRVSHAVDFMAEEGIPLFLVPRQATAQAFLAADGHGERRRVLGTHAPSIIADCRKVWDEHQSPAVQGWIDLLDAGVRALESGHPHPAQAMFTAVMDTIMFAVPERRKYVRHENGDPNYSFLLDEEEFDTALVMIPIWSVFEANWEPKGHPVPRSLNRHAALHRASTRQYSKRNAVQALMLATSLLAWFVRYASQSQP